MWEISLFSKLKYKKYFEYIKDNLQQHLKEKTIFALAKNGGTIVLSIASEALDKTDANLIKNLIAEVMVLIEKEEFLKSKLVFDNLSSVCKMALIKALVLYDIEDDISIVKKHISLNTNIDMHAFFIFRLKELQKKWKHLIFLTGDESFYANNVEILLEFLRFLIESLPIRQEQVTVVYEEKEYSIISEPGKNKKPQITGKITDEIDLVTSLISLSPKKIYLKDLCLSEETHKMLKYVFYKRVYDYKERKVNQKQDIVE